MDGRVTLIADLMPALELGPINPDDPAGKALAGAFAALDLEVCRCELCLNHPASLERPIGLSYREGESGAPSLPDSPGPMRRSPCTSIREIR